VIPSPSARSNRRSSRSANWHRNRAMGRVGPSCVEGMFIYTGDASCVRAVPSCADRPRDALECSVWSSTPPVSPRPVGWSRPENTISRHARTRSAAILAAIIGTTCSLLATTARVGCGRLPVVSWGRSSASRRGRERFVEKHGVAHEVVTRRLDLGRHSRARGDGQAESGAGRRYRAGDTF